MLDEDRTGVTLSPPKRMPLLPKQLLFRDAKRSNRQLCRLVRSDCWGRSVQRPSDRFVMRTHNVLHPQHRRCPINVGVMIRVGFREERIPDCSHWLQVVKKRRMVPPRTEAASWKRERFVVPTTDYEESLPRLRRAEMDGVEKADVATIAKTLKLIDDYVCRTASDVSLSFDLTVNGPAVRTGGDASEFSGI